MTGIFYSLKIHDLAVDTTKFNPTSKSIQSITINIGGCGGECNNYCTSVSGIWAGSYYVASFDLSTNNLNNQYFDSTTPSDSQIEIYSSGTTNIAIT